MAWSGNAHGILFRPSQFSLSAGRRISAVHPHMSLSKWFAREPADFYGLPVAFVQNSFQ